MPSTTTTSSSSTITSAIRNALAHPNDDASVIVSPARSAIVAFVLVVGGAADFFAGVLLRMLTPTQELVAGGVAVVATTVFGIMLIDYTLAAMGIDQAPLFDVLDTQHVTVTGRDAHRITQWRHAGNWLALILSSGLLLLSLTVHTGIGSRIVGAAAIIYGVLHADIARRALRAD